MDYFDLHCDTISRCFDEKIGIFENDFNVSIKKGDCFKKWVQCLAIWIPDNVSYEDSWDYFEARYNYFLSLEKSLDIVKEFKDLSSTKKGFILCVEGARLLNGDLSRIEQLRNMNIRLVTLTWNGKNELGGGAHENFGLTNFGYDAVKRFEDNNIVIDVSHASDKLFYDVASVAEKPFIASHSNSRSVCNVPRNLTDEQFKLICKKGGIVGLNFCREFLSQNSYVTFDDLYKHIYRFLDLGGEHNICIGSDFDGCDLVGGIEDITNIQDLYNYLLSKNFSEELLENIFFKNAENFFINYDKLQKLK